MQGFLCQQIVLIWTIVYLCVLNLILLNNVFKIHHKVLQAFSFQFAYWYCCS
jgi:hypothetical protein